MTIRQLGQGTPGEDAQIPFYDVPNGVDRRCTIAALRALILGDSASDVEGMVTQYSNPSASGFSVTIAPLVDGQNVWLLLQPTGAFAAGTIVLPAKTELLDHQEVEIVSTQNVATLTLNGNGASLTGAPTALTANTPVKLRFDVITGTWYRAV